MTDDLAERLRHHNSGASPHTAKYRPCRIETAIAFSSPEKATAFEVYLKSGSGREFAQKAITENTAGKRAGKPTRHPIGVGVSGNLAIIISLPQANVSASRHG